MLDQAIDSIEEAALAHLVAEQVAERRDLEFKRDLPGRSDEQVKEFLADVTSLANASGGDLIFGIEDVSGIASALPGVEVDDVDAEVLRLESIIRTGVDPRIVGVRTRWAPLASGRGCLVIRIPASLNAPHRTTFRNSGRFYNRTSRGKYEMDVHELRQAFTEVGQLPERFRHLHAQAVGTAKGVNMPFGITPNPTAVVSIIPLSLFRDGREISVTSTSAIWPIKSSSHSSLDMIEGVLMHTPVERPTGTVRSIAITYRSGRTDVAWTIGGMRQGNDGFMRKLAFMPSFEEGLLEATTSTQSVLHKHGVEGPWVVLVTVYDMLKAQLVLGDGYPSNAAYRDHQLIGEIRVDNLDEAAIFPMLRNFWLLFGEHRPEGRIIGSR